MKASPFLESIHHRIPATTMFELSRFVAQVENELQRQAVSGVSLVQRASEHTLAAGGKRLRPILVHVAAMSIGQPFDRARTVRLGACMEMIHMATLMHDDVIDEAESRRGREAVHREFGTTQAILTGDVLLAKAMRILAMDGDLPIIRMVSDAVKEMAEGEVKELALRGDFDVDEADFLEMLRMKTASFVEACCRVGARIAGATEAQEIALGRYGHHIGLAFQIADDILDYRGDPAKTGKPLAGDFRDGSATLPLIYLRPNLAPIERESILGDFAQGALASEAGVRGVVAMMTERGTLARAERLAQGHADRAFAELSVLPASPARSLLESVIDYVQKREQ